MTAKALDTLESDFRIRSFAMPADWYAIALFVLFAVDNLLLLQFLGLPAIYVALLALPIAFGISQLAKSQNRDAPRIPLAVFGIALLASLTLFVLGGEGRFFYANADWQIRDAILNDMSSMPWPYAYALDGQAAILRAPLGMYLGPSLAGSSGSEIALLLSNSLRLALLITLAWQMFDSRGKRIFALCIFFGFSGWDIIGTLIYNNAGIPVSWDHLETWNFGFQYSSHITQAFWVPQHAIAGWASALMFLLWAKGLAPLGWFAATVPLVAIWSPLAIMGAVPFVLLAGVSAVLKRNFNWRDVTLASVALAVSLPALIYMQVDAANLGSEVRDAPASIYILIFALEVAPFVVLPLLDRTNSVLERLTLWTILLCLILMPYWKIGLNSDFQMRASIMPLALLALAFIDWILKTAEKMQFPKTEMGFAFVAIALGFSTPAFELHRSLVNGPSPKPRCSLIGVWNKQTGLVAPYATYLAEVDSFPIRIRETPAIAGKHDPANCWDREWIVAAPAR